MDVQRVVLIACAKKKTARRAKAKHLYQSPLFKLSLQYAQQLQPEAIYILSAKHGLLRLDEEIEPYDLTLHDMPAHEVKEWAQEVAQKLQLLHSLEDSYFILLAGRRYRKYLLPYLKSYEIPMEGLGIGKQLRFLKDQIS